MDGSRWERMSAAGRPDGRDLLIGVLGVVVAVLLVRSPDGGAPAAVAERQEEPTAVVAADPVSVRRVLVDRRSRRRLDISFDTRLGEGLVGEILDPPPAQIAPPVEGVWRWASSDTLRFHGARSLPVGGTLRVSLLPERLLGEGRVLRGSPRIEVAVPPFRVESLSTREEAMRDSGNRVVVRGTITFSYPVDPTKLAPRLHVYDPLGGTDDTVEVHLRTGHIGERIAFATEPVVKARRRRALRLVVDAELHPHRSPSSLGAPWEKEIPIGSETTVTVRGVQAEAGEKSSVIKVVLSSVVEPEEAERHIRVQPAVPFHVAADGNEVLLSGDFQPGAVYRVRVEPGLIALGGATLTHAVDREIRIPDLRALVEPQSPGMFLPASGAHALAIESINVEAFELTVDRVYPNNLYALLRYFEREYEGEWEWHRSSLPEALGDRLVERTVSVAAEKNRRTVTTVRLADELAGRRGIFRIGVRRPGHSRRQYRWLLLTDLGIVARKGPDGLLVWVSSFADLSPIDGAKVRLLSDQNQLIRSGRTDERGIWRAEHLAADFAEHDPFVILVERDRESSFLLFDQARADMSGLDIDGARISSAYDAYLYGERDIYRPGETVQGVAVVRDRQRQVPPEMPLLLRHRDPTGRERETLRLRSDALGVASFRLDVESSERTGRHALELLAGEETIGRYDFQVEEFVPDRIEVAVSVEDPGVALGEELTFGVESAYLFGPPAAGMAVESRMRLIDAPFAPEGFAAFTFRDPEREMEPQEVFVEQAVLDAEGTRRFTARLPEELSPPAALQAVLTARVSERGGRGVVAARRLPVHPYPYYIGLRRRGDGAIDPGRAASFEWVAVSPEGEEVPAGRLRVELFRDEWSTVVRRTSSGGYRYESTREPRRVKTRPVEGGVSRGEIEMTPPRWGSYRLRVSDPDSGASTQVQFYASGWGYSPWAIRNPGRLELALDRDEYRSGESARVQVRAPFGGRLLLTVERDGVEHVQVVDMPENTATVDLPVYPAYAPNAYVTATLVRAADALEPGDVGRAVGAVPIQVDRTSNRLDVAVDARAEIRPESELGIAVQAAPHSVVTVAAVDEGILQLIAQQTPDPFAHFYRKQALTTESFDIYSLLLPDLEDVEGATLVGGGRAGDDAMRTEPLRRTEPVAFWSGPVQADEAGRAELSFSVPDFQGALRVMAVAHEGARFGSGEQRVRVRAPLAILPTAPRFASFGETIRVPVTVRNDTGREGDFVVSLAVSGPVRVVGWRIGSGEGIERPLEMHRERDASGETARGDTRPPRGKEADGANVHSRRLKIARGAEETVFFTLETGHTAGAVKLTFRAAGNGETRNAVVEVPVRPDLPHRAIEQVGRVSGRMLELPVRGRDLFRPGTMIRELRIGALPLVPLAGKLRQLVRYPYGCVEQTTSTVFPLVYLGDLAPKLDPEGFAEREPEVMVQAGIQRLATMQLPEGGFSMWPYGTYVAEWGSIYATHFLVEARRAGHHVPEYVSDQALAFVAGQAREKSDGDTRARQRLAYSLYVLARAGRADLAGMNRLRDRAGRGLDAESTAFLAAAYAAAGLAEPARGLANRIGEASTVRESGGNLGSPVRNRAVILQALRQAAPDDPRVVKLAERLVTDAAGRLWSTQETAFALLALGELVREQSRRGYGGDVYVGEEKLGRIDEETTTFTNIRGSGPVRIEMEDGYESGGAFYSLYTRGTPTDEAFSPERAGMEIARRLLRRDGTPLDGETVEQGALLIQEVRLRSLSGALENVAVEARLASGLEVENPRLATSESLPWLEESDVDPDFVDMRQDRVLTFTDLPAGQWITTYTQLRAVVPGRFRLPPVRAEAMYRPTVQATGERGWIEVLR